MRGLRGSGVLVAGGTGGIGAATARRFLEEGCRVYVCGHDSADVAETVADLTTLGAITGSACDVSNPAAVAAMVDAAEVFTHGIDILANNAGIAWQEAFLDITIEHWDTMLAVNLRGMFLVAQAVAHRMVAAGRSGSIVNMASTNALSAEARYAHYNASKGAVVQLTRTMAVELGPLGIRVNALCPGYIDTPLNREIAARTGTADFADRYAQDNIPLHRPGTGDEVASAYAFLASSEASFIHGTTLVVDGGQLAVM